MQELQKRLDSLRDTFVKLYEKLEIDEKLKQIADLEKQVAEPEIWRDVKHATELNQELAKMQGETEPYLLLKTQIDDLGELIEISG